MAATRIGNVDVSVGGGICCWTSGLAVDCDGCPEAYHPEGSPPGLDHLANAGRLGNWWGVATDTGEPDGNPIIQGSGSPAPGFLVSCTALADHGFANGDPRRYVDANKIPYVSVPPELRRLGVKLGDVCLVGYKDKECCAVVAEVGPLGSIGEGSMQLARVLGINPDPRRGGVGAGVRYSIFMGSTRGWPRTVADIDDQVNELRPSLLQCV